MICLSSLPAYIHQLRAEPQEIVVQKLLAHFPLLKVGNVKAKTEYLALIPQILTYSNEKGAYVEESRQLLSFSVIHPALTSEEHAHFNWWISHLNERFTSSYPSHPQHHPYITNPKGDHNDFTQCIQRQVGNGRLNGSNSYYRDSGLVEDTPQNNLMLSTENLSNLFANQSSISSAHNHPNVHLPLKATLSAPATVNVIVSSSQHVHTQNNQGIIHVWTSQEIKKKGIHAVNWWFIKRAHSKFNILIQFIQPKELGTITCIINVFISFRNRKTYLYYDIYFKGNLPPFILSHYYSL